MTHHGSLPIMVTCECHGMGDCPSLYTREIPKVIRPLPPLVVDGNGADEGETKPSNPKDVIGSRKLDLGLVPDSAVVGMAEALMEGALKYGRYNWRVAGVRASIYHAACRRHLAKWWNGEDEEPATRIHHLKNAACCLAILIDAAQYGKLTDDRPPAPDREATARQIDSREELVRHLREVFKDHHPHQFTIQDTEI
jgi:hypothetical protein